MVGDGLLRKEFDFAFSVYVILLAKCNLRVCVSKRIDEIVYNH